MWYVLRHVGGAFIHDGYVPNERPAAPDIVTTHDSGTDQEMLVSTRNPIPPRGGAAPPATCVT